MNDVPESEATMMPQTVPSREQRHPVLVVGGALTGLSTALFLASHGVRCLLVERHPGLLAHPRARGFNHRTMELYRQVGLEPAIQAASYASAGFEWIAVRAETLAAEHVPVEEPADDVASTEITPVGMGAIDQDRLETILRARAIELGADVRYSTELVSFEQDVHGVTAVIRDRSTGEETRVLADWLVAADGYTSPVRKQLGIPVDGPGPFFHVLTMTIDADLTPALRGRRVSIAYLQQPGQGATLLAHDDAGLRWVFGVGFSPEHDSVDNYGDERCRDLVRAAAGLPDVDVRLRPQIPGTDLKVLDFPIGAQLARLYRDGRVFLVGDAAHIVPPTGGLGANTGIQDAHNLAWKLAAVLHGQAGAGLLDTYHAERNPVGDLTMRQALARWNVRVGAGGQGAGEPLLDYSSAVFGYQYRSSATPGAPQDGARPLCAAKLAGQPGTRAPHVWVNGVSGGAERISTIDLYGSRFVLLTGGGGATWLAAAQRVAERLGVPVDAYRFGVELGGHDAAPVHALGPDEALLVRPDGFVAWRSAPALGAAPGDAEAALEQALRSTLARD
ncbi:MAG TPA: FAD-dependent monooxygenase [Actinomycetota bacterium]